MSGMNSDPRIAQALIATLTTPDECGKGKIHRDCNLVDGLYAIALAIEGLTGAVERMIQPLQREVSKPRVLTRR